MTRHYFFPGFTPATGGLLRELDLQQRQAAFHREAWLTRHGIAAGAIERTISLFCYEPVALPALLLQLAQGPVRTALLVAAGRSAAAVVAAIARLDASQAGWNAHALLAITQLPLLTQHDYDHLLWSCDLNFVRGEDSWVRAIWAGKPFVWQPYPQDDGAHRPKLAAFLDLAQAPAGWRGFHRSWCGADPGEGLPPLDPAAWEVPALALRETLLEQTDLTARLLAFASEKR